MTITSIIFHMQLSSHRGRLAPSFFIWNAAPIGEGVVCKWLLYKLAKANISSYLQMPADSISNCQCVGRHGRDEIAGKRTTRSSSSDSSAERIAVIHESQGWISKKDFLTRKLLYISPNVLFSVDSYNRFMLVDAIWWQAIFLRLFFFFLQCKSLASKNHVTKGLVCGIINWNVNLKRRWFTQINVVWCLYFIIFYFFTYSAVHGYFDTDLLLFPNYLKKIVHVFAKFKKHQNFRFIALFSDNNFKMCLL